MDRGLAIHPSVQNALKDHVERIRALERQLVGANLDHVVFYDKYPQIDNWLYVEATQPRVPGGYTIELVDSSPTTGGSDGIHLLSEQNAVILDAAAGLALLEVSYATGEGVIGLIVNGALGSGGGAIQLRVDSDPNGAIFIGCDASSMTFSAGTSVYIFRGVHARLQAGSAFSIADSSPGDASESSFTGFGSTILRVFEDGNVQMRFLPTSNPGIAGYLWNDSGTVKIS